MQAPPVVPDADWENFYLPFTIGSGRSFVGTPGSSMRLAFFKHRLTSDLVGMVWFGNLIEGPPGHVHGGVSSYVLDEAMGSACWLKGYPCVAKSIAVSFLHMTPIGVDLHIHAHVISVENRDVWVKAKIFDDQDKVYSEAEGHFSRLSRERLEYFLNKNEDHVDIGQFVFPT